MGAAGVNKPGPITIVVADDHPIFRDGFCKLLALESDFEIVAQVQDGRQVLDIIDHFHPDILLLHLSMLGLSSFTILEALRDRGDGRTKTIIYTAGDRKSSVAEALERGAKGFGLKQTATETLIQGIRKVHGGEIWIDSAVRQFSRSDDAPSSATSGAWRGRKRSPLSQREEEVVTLVARGFTNLAIGEKLFISVQNVKNHLHNIFDKLGLSDRLELTLWAVAAEPKIGMYAGVERRQKRRFEIDQEVEYEVLGKQQATQKGTGKVLNVSSASVWLSTQMHVSAGGQVRLTIPWPLAGDNTERLRLVVQGQVVAGDDQSAIVTIEEYRFAKPVPLESNTRKEI